MRSSPAPRGYPQKKYLRTRRSSRKRKTRLFTALARVIKPAKKFCIELVPCISHGSNSSREDWRRGKRRAIRSSHTMSPSISTLQPNPLKATSATDTDDSDKTTCENHAVIGVTSRDIV